MNRNETESPILSSDHKEYFTMADLAKITNYNSDYLRQKCQSGEIQGTFIGKKFRGFWLATVSAVEEYQRNKPESTVGGSRKPRF